MGVQAVIQQAQIVDMHMLAGANGLGGIPDHLVVTAHGMPQRHIVQSHFVTRRDQATRGGPARQDSPAHQWLARNGHSVR